MSKSLVDSEISDGIAVLTLDDPKRRNALSSTMMAEMMRLLDDARADPDARVIVLAANGPVFSSGHDLRELAGGDTEGRTILFGMCTELMEKIRLLPMPVIAQVQGLATAAGCQLVATCDMAVAAEDAAFATPGVNIGLFCTTPGVALGRAVATKLAMEMLLTGEPLSASDALAAGLVNRVVPSDELEHETMTLARKVADAPAEVVAIGKSAFYEQIALDMPQAYTLAQSVMVDNLRFPDASEGIAAFLEKRSPRWNTRTR